MKIGIYLGYGPKTVLGKEGLGRYLANLINNLVLNNNTVTIACHEWLLNSVEDLLKDFQMSDENISFIVSNKTPIVWKIYDWWTKEKIKKRKETIKFNRVLYSIIESILTITSVIKFCIIGILFLLIGSLIFPIALVLGVFYIVLKFFVKVVGKGKFKTKKLIKNVIKYYLLMEKIQKNWNIYMYQIIVNHVQNDLVNKINSSEKQDIWYSPSIFWEQFNKINGTKVINVPDLVTKEFPVQWGYYSSVVSLSKQYEKTIQNGTYFITYSQYVKDTLLVNKYGKYEENIVVINHNINDLSSYITIKSNLTNNNFFTKAYCESVMQTLKEHTKCVKSYIHGFDFKDVKFIFYASQARPHKNLLNLVKAYEYLLRNRYIGIKLFLTCNLESDEELFNYIREKRLQYDIISFYNVSSKQLAALYYQAQLVVNPTLFEGGFPFTFGEGMSVGTPSVMSRIPQVEEITKMFNLEECLFDPYDFKDIAEKIIYGLNNIEELKEKQYILYKYLYENHSQKKVGMEYENTFKRFIQADSNNSIIKHSTSI